MKREELIEAMARGVCEERGTDPDAEVFWYREYGVDLYRTNWRQHADSVNAALATLEARIPGLADLIDGKAAIVPAETTTEMNTAHRLARMNVEGGYYDGPSPYAAMIAASPYKDAKP